MLNVNIWLANAAQKSIKLLYGFMILSILICCVLFVDIGYGRDIHNNYLPTLILIPFGMIFMFGILTCLEKGDFSSKYIVYIALVLFAIQVYKYLELLFLYRLGFFDINNVCKCFCSWRRCLVVIMVFFKIS